jgi:hypothetical protein
MEGTPILVKEPETKNNLLKNILFAVLALFLPSYFTGALLVFLFGLDMEFFLQQFLSISIGYVIIFTILIVFSFLQIIYHKIRYGVQGGLTFREGSIVVNIL